MKQTISFITLGVRDLARSRRFYSDLGWKESSEQSGRSRFFDAGTVKFALYGRAAGRRCRCRGSRGGFPGFSLATTWNRKPRSTPCPEAKAPAAACSNWAKSLWGGYRGYFADPEGFLWEVCFNPSSAG